MPKKSPEKERLDKLLVDRGLAESRTRAQAMILAGEVLVDNQRSDKPGHSIPTTVEIRIKSEPLKYVSRGGLKLEAALSEFHIDPGGKGCVDIGASTGGFTDCLLQHGAASVWALDVGHNQLAWKIRQDTRVVVRDGINARSLRPEDFPELFELATVDVSFISLTKILPSLASIVVPGADVIALIKPQFEVGKGEVGKGGIVTNPAQHRRVVAEVIAAAEAVGLDLRAVIDSPILGAEGNREFLAHLVRRDTPD
jgi:23S rRNA (cytidine1920-2'-O)/16S rRNA (cytidine1409-2'-O)-methyltransferase